MVRVGVHVSIAGSLEKAVLRAKERGCDCFQIFTRNPRGWAAKPITDSDADRFRNAVEDSDLGPVFAHMPYLPNLAGADGELYKKSIQVLLEEIRRCDLLGIPYLVTHLGHARDTPDSGRARVIAAIQQVYEEYDGSVMLLLENTAGEKNSIGSRIEDIATVFSGIGMPDRVGICLDTCHAFAAGYEQRMSDGLNNLVEAIDAGIGLSHLCLIHLNDAKGELGTGLDRHDHIGLGSIGMAGMKMILHHPALRSVPLICETPVDNRRGDDENIRVVRMLARDHSS